MDLKLHVAAEKKSDTADKNLIDFFLLLWKIDRRIEKERRAQVKVLLNVLVNHLNNKLHHESRSI
ncbi:MAG TPA: hypothetical protein VKR53_09050 [Puia sp.]|nr:hypothetical protein [Puia sp.]